MPSDPAERRRDDPIAAAVQLPPDRARAALEALLDERRDHPADLDRIARALWGLGDLAAAERGYAAAAHAVTRVANDLTSDAQADLLVRLGAARFRLGRLESALIPLYDALELSDSGYAALQLGNTLRFLGERDEAEGHLTRAYNRAKAARDATLAGAALCALGELDLGRAATGSDPEAARRAIDRFGEALGLSELTRHPAPAVYPLAGLAEAQLHWRAPHKAPELAERSLTRARSARDPALEARAWLALAAVGRGVQAWTEARSAAASAPHRPLWLRAALGAWRLGDGGVSREALLEAAEGYGMRPEAAALRGSGRSAS